MLAASAPGASAPVVVSFSVASHTAVTNQCTARAAWNFGAVQPGTPITTATGSDVCRVRFTSSNDTAALRLYQADREGTAMARQDTTWDLRAGEIQSLLAVDATPDGRVVGVGQDGNVRTSANSGVTFPLGGSGTAGTWSSLNDVDILDSDSQQAWVASHSGQVLRTTDGGTGWTRLTGVLPGHINAILAVDTNTAIVADDQSNMARTTNGGTSWSPISTAGFGSTAKAFARRSSTDLWLVGNNALVRRSLDGGLTWNPPAAMPAWAHYTSVELAGAAAVWIVGTTGGQSFVARSGDNGATWENRSTWAGEQLEDVAAISATEAWAAGRRGTLLHTTDSGASWVRRSPPTTETITGIARAGDGQLVLTTMNDRVHRTPDGITWTTTVSGNADGALNDVATDPADRRIAVAVGDGGRVLRSTDRGATWTSVTSNTSAHLQSVVLLDDGRGWAVGNGGAIIRTTNSGQTWSTQSSTVPEDLLDVSSRDGRLAWAVGRGGRIVRTTDGGSNWSTVASGVTVDLFGVALVDASNAWVSGAQSTIRRTTDGGASWLVRTHTQSAQIYGIWAEDATTAHVASEWPGWTTTTNGGTSWTEGLWRGGRPMLAMEAGRPVGAIGQFGNVNLTADSGTTWEWGGNPGHYAHLRAAAAIDANRLVVVGENGTISTSRSRDSVSDFGGAGSTWASPANGLFGACLQAVGAGTTAAWTADAANAPGRCEPLAGDPWSAVPTTPTTIATITTPGTDGVVDMVWGARSRPDQPPGRYSATVTFEAIAPAA